jgi:AcrR family transcriptional regulator
MNEKITLKPKDWIQGGFRALLKGGAGAIRIEVIAREMKVSKGSFYWHFSDVAALKEAMLKHWVKEATFDFIETIKAGDILPEQQLVKTIEFASSKKSALYGGVKVEGAIRDWSHYDKRVAKIVDKIEGARIDFLTDIFVKSGQKENEAKRNGRILLGALIGLEHLSSRGRAELREDLLALLDRLL